MRKKFVIAATTGALTLTGLAVAAPALAAAADPGHTQSSRVERIQNALSDLVGDGSITQEQADVVAGTLSETGLGGGGGHHGWGPDLTAAAEALGMGAEDLRAALEADGATLAQVAEEQGVAVDTVVQALVTAGQERVAQAVTDGRITQEEADQRLADLQQRVTDHVDAAFPDRGPGHRGTADAPPEQSADD